MTDLDLVFRLRMLQHKCDAGLGLDVWEIDQLCQLEAAFAPGEDDRGGDGRRHGRRPVNVGAIVRDAELNERVVVDDLAPGGLRCSNLPLVVVGQRVDVVLDDRPGAVSFRSKAVVTWVTQTGNTCTIGLAFVGAPIRIQYGASVVPASDVFDSIPPRHAA